MGNSNCSQTGTSVAGIVRSQILQDDEKRIWRIQDFPDLSFWAVAKIFSRLERQGFLYRVGKGTYYYPGGRRKLGGKSVIYLRRIKSRSKKAKSNPDGPKSIPPEKDFYGDGAAPVPTDARPGTAEKIEVLRTRAEAGQAIFHKEDVSLDNYCPDPLGLISWGGEE